jgi:L-aminoadipate-semialdehyde dehydrogenase
MDLVRLSKEAFYISECTVGSGGAFDEWKSTGAPKRRRTAPVTAVTAVTAVAAPAIGSSDNPSNLWSEAEARSLLMKYVAEVPVTYGEMLSRDTSRKVFLTGATGFLGSFILRGLLDQGVQVVALVRADDFQAGLKRLVGTFGLYGLRTDGLDTNVEVVCGDIEEPSLGMSQAALKSLSKCDVFVHNAAKVDFTQPLESLLVPNVLAVQRAVEISCMHGMHFVHVSSLSVFSLYRFVGTSETTRPDPSLLICGYSRSKWLGEQIVWDAMSKGMSACIVRPGRIMGSSETGASSVQDWFVRYIRASVAMKMTWDLDHWTDMTQVDDVSAMVVGASLEKRTLNRAIHAVSKEQLSSNEITAILSDFGYEMRETTYDEWMSLLEASGGTHSPHY